MELLAGQIKKDNALCISDAQKLRSEFTSAITKIKVVNLNLNLNYSHIELITNSFEIILE